MLPSEAQHLNLGTLPYSLSGYKFPESAAVYNFHSSSSFYSEASNFIRLMFLTTEGTGAGKVKWHRLQRVGFLKKKARQRAGALWPVFASVVSDSQS